MNLSNLGWSRPARSLGAAAVLAGTVLVPAVSASAAPAATSASGPSPSGLGRFAHCPVSNPAVFLCITGSMTGSFTIGSQTLTTPKPATLTLGLANGPNGIYAVEPTDGTPALKAAPIPVTLFGLPPLPGILSVTATPQLTATPTVNILNLVNQTGTAVGLTLDVAINNPLLGSGCTIGSAGDPLSVNLTTGTTAPPPPNQPISGSKGTAKTTKSGVIVQSGVKLVDNAFAVPGANGCGLFGILDPVLDLMQGLPSPAGHNAAVFSGTTYLVAASVVRGQ